MGCFVSLFFLERGQQIDLLGFGSLKILPKAINRHQKKDKCKINIQRTSQVKKLAFDKELLWYRLAD